VPFDLRDGVGTTGDGLLAALALPDANSLALDGVLSAEGADVAGVLRDFHLLHLLTQGGTVSIVETCQKNVQSLASSIAQSSNIAVSVESRSRIVFDVLTVFAEENWKAYLVPYLPVIPTSANPVSFYSSFLP
jgi:hypothetical protein